MSRPPLSKFAWHHALLSINLMEFIENNHHADGLELDKSSGINKLLEALDAAIAEDIIDTVKDIIYTVKVSTGGEA